jgi:hypothetical protein
MIRLDTKRATLLLVACAALAPAQTVQAADNSAAWQDGEPALLQSVAAGSPGAAAAAGQGRGLLQAAGLCPAKEYFCGEDDIFLDSAFQALAGAGCVDDTGDSHACLQPWRRAW